MLYKRTVKLKDIQKLQDSATECRVLCSNCGHSMLLGNQEKMICYNCGDYVFKDKKTEFEYRTKEALYKKKVNI